MARGIGANRRNKDSSSGRCETKGSLPKVSSSTSPLNAAVAVMSPDRARRVAFLPATQSSSMRVADWVYSPSRSLPALPPISSSVRRSPPRTPLAPVSAQEEKPESLRKQVLKRVTLSENAQSTPSRRRGAGNRLFSSRSSDRRVYPLSPRATPNSPAAVQSSVNYDVFEVHPRPALAFHTPDKAFLPPIERPAEADDLLHPFAVADNLPKNAVLSSASGRPMTVDDKGRAFIVKALLRAIKLAPEERIQLDSPELRFLYAVVKGLDSGIRIEIRHVVVLKGSERLRAYNFSLDRYFADMPKQKGVRANPGEITAEVALSVMGSDLMLVEVTFDSKGEVLLIRSPFSIRVDHYGLHFSAIVENPVQAIIKRHGRRLRALFRELVVQKRLTGFDKLIRFFYYFNDREPLWAEAGEGVMKVLLLEMTQALSISAAAYLNRSDSLHLWSHEDGQDQVRRFLSHILETKAMQEALSFLKTLLDDPLLALPDIWPGEGLCAQKALLAFSSAYGFLEQVFTNYQLKLPTGHTTFSDLRNEGSMKVAVSTLMPLFGFELPAQASSAYRVSAEAAKRFAEPHASAYSPAPDERDRDRPDNMLYYDGGGVTAKMILRHFRP